MYKCDNLLAATHVRCEVSQNCSSKTDENIPGNSSSQPNPPHHHHHLHPRPQTHSIPFMNVRCWSIFLRNERDRERWYVHGSIMKLLLSRRLTLSSVDLHRCPDPRSSSSFKVGLLHFTKKPPLPLPPHLHTHTSSLSIYVHTRTHTLMC